MLRLNVGVDASSHAFVRTGGKDSKFGIHPRDERAAAALLSANPQLRFAGVHAHIGSQIYDESAYLENASALVAAAERFATFGLQSERIVIGGGFGVPSDPTATTNGSTSQRPSPPPRLTFAARRRNAASARLAVGIEPGRAIVADAGTTLYRVLAVKRQSHRTFVVVDGGIAENPRPGALRRTLPRRRRDAAARRRSGDNALRPLVRKRRTGNNAAARVTSAPVISSRCARPARTPTAWPATTTAFPDPRSSASQTAPTACGAPRNHRRRPPQRRRLGGWVMVT